MYKELIERLRVNAEWAEGNEWEIPLMMHDDLVAAADAIEKLQAELVSYRQVRKALSDRGFDNFGIMFAAYDQVKAERDAAVADLTAAGLCNYCGHWNGSKCTKRGKCEFVWRGLEGRNGAEN